MIWDASKMNDADIKKELQKVLIGVTHVMSLEDRVFFLN